MKQNLTILVPVYNEEKTVGKVLDKLLTLPRVKEIIVVDDASKDSTPEVLEKYKSNDKVKIHIKDKNKGKGHSVKVGVELATAEYFIVQDADLELSPDSIELLFEKLENSDADLINATRIIKGKKVNIITKLANIVVPVGVFILFGKKISDVVSCYKLMATEKYQSLGLESNGFEIETEIIVKAIKKGYKIEEQVVPYHPRTAEEGKHVTKLFNSGLRIIGLLIKYRFSS